MGRNLAKIAGPVLAVGLVAGCANFGKDDLEYTAKETLGAPVSFLVGANKDIQRDAGQGLYNLPARLASETGRFVNGVAYPFTNNKYSVDFGSEKIHPMADNDTVKMTGWGAGFGYLGGEPAWGAFAGALGSFVKKFVYPSEEQKK